MESVEEIDRRFVHVYMSLRNCNQALTETYHISKETSSQEELDILNSHPFSFYRVALQYCFNSEYNKFLEPDLERDKNYPQIHVASLYKLNNICKKDLGEQFTSTYNQNLEELNKIERDEFRVKQKRLRNKKFCHSDNDEVNDPLSIKGLTSFEISVAFTHLETCFKIFNRCTLHALSIEYSYKVPHDDNRTINFVRYQAKYKKYYYNNAFKNLGKMQ